MVRGSYMLCRRNFSFEGQKPVDLFGIIPQVGPTMQEEIIRHLTDTGGIEEIPEVSILYMVRQIPRLGDMLNQSSATLPELPVAI